MHRYDVFNVYVQETRKLIGGRGTLLGGGLVLWYPPSLPSGMIPIRFCEPSIIHRSNFSSIHLLCTVCLLSPSSLSLSLSSGDEDRQHQVRSPLLTVLLAQRHPLSLWRLSLGPCVWDTCRHGHLQHPRVCWTVCLCSGGVCGQLHRHGCRALCFWVRWGMD